MSEGRKSSHGFARDITEQLIPWARMKESLEEKEEYVLSMGRPRSLFGFEGSSSDDRIMSRGGSVWSAG